MMPLRTVLFTSVLTVTMIVAGCTPGQETDSSLEPVTAASGEHERDTEGAGEGDEPGVEYGLDETLHSTRNGAHLMITYDAELGAFVGSVTNTGETILELVRVEVHLSNGKELGPTTPVELAPGQSIDVSLAPESTDFERWSAHAEVGNEEHGEAGEGEHRGEDGEHRGEEGEGEHR